MNNNKKNAGRKKSAIPGLIILAAVLIFNAVEDPEIAVTILVPVVILGAAAAIISAVKKGSAGKTAAAAQSRPVQARPVQTRMPQAGRSPAVRAAQEEAVHCAHSRGKEKYLEQLDGFLANGIIDKAEYRLMRERYSKLQIEDDYH